MFASRTTHRRHRRLALVAVTLVFATLAVAPPASADGSVPNPAQTVDTSPTAEQLAQALVGAGVAISNVVFTGDPAARGAFAFAAVTPVGFGSGLVMSSGSVTDVVGPNVSDSVTTNLGRPGDADLSALSTFDTFDAAVLEFDFVPITNQVVFHYAFASDEYPEWVNTPYNDVFAFFVNGTNCAEVRQVAGDPAAPFVPVAVNNINDSNPVQDPPPVAMRPDLFRANYHNPAGASLFDLELDGITSVLTCQAPVVPGAANHMKLAIADSSDPILDSAVFIQAGSLVSNDNPVADLSLYPAAGPAPLTVQAIVEGEDPDGAPLTYTVNWGDGTPDSSGGLPDETAVVEHTYTAGGEYLVTLTVSNGTLSGTSVDDVDVFGTPPEKSAPVITGQPAGQSVLEGEPFSFNASASGVPTPSVQWQVSTGGGFADIPGATATTYSGTAGLADDGHLFRAVFTNSEGQATTDAALLTVTAPDTTPPALAPAFSAPTPFLVGTPGITASPNASDDSGILSQSCGPVDTTTPGARSVTCTATDNAGNSASVNLPYVVGYQAVNVKPTPGAAFKRSAQIPVSFQLADFNGVLSDTGAAAIRPAVTVAFGTLAPVTPGYNKRTNLFTATLQTNKPPAGPYTIAIRVTVGGAGVTAVTVPVTIS